MGRRWVTSAIPVGLLMSACGLTAQEVVELPELDRPLDLVLEELYAVGGLDAEPWEEFQAINDAAFGPDGRLYLLDAPSEAVLALAPDGRFLRRVGRPGQGPGEHDNASGLATLPDGRVAVWDFGKRAFLLFGPDGAPLDQVRPDFSVGLPDDPFVTADDGSLLAFPFRLTSSADGLSYLSSSGVRTAPGGLPVLRIRLRDGAPVEVVTRARLQRWSGGDDIPIHRAFQPWPSWGPVAGGGIAVHQSEEYRIEVLAADGTVERVLTRPIRVRETTSSDRDAYARDLRRRFERGEIIVVGGGGGGAAERVRAQLAETWYYPRITPVLEITADGGDRIWVRRRHPADPTRPGPVDVLSTGGDYLGTLPPDGPGLPIAFGPGGRVAFLEQGKLEVPLVRVVRTARVSPR